VLRLLREGLAWIWLCDKPSEGWLGVAAEQNDAPYIIESSPGSSSIIGRIQFHLSNRTINRSNVGHKNHGTKY
jgi:hypothetical protein